MQNRMMVFATNSGNDLARQVCACLSIEPGRALVERFGDQEVRVELRENVRDADVFIIGSLCPPAENWLEMMFLSEAARYSSAGRITLVPTYLGYNRQDRKDKPRVPISAHIMIDMLKHRGANRALLVDLHSEQTAAHFHPQVVTDHLYGSTVAVPYLRQLLGDEFVVAAPDHGAVPRASKYLELLRGNARLVIFNKLRKEAGKVEEDSVSIIGDVVGKNILFVDDMIDTGGTLIANAREARKANAKKIYAFATHALFSKGTQIFEGSPFEEIVVTDSIPHQATHSGSKVKVTTLSLDKMLAQAIRRTHDGQSLSEMLIPRV